MRTILVLIVTGFDAALEIARRVERWYYRDYYAERDRARLRREWSDGT